MLEKLVPIPPEFYDDHKDEDLITGKGTIFPFAVFLYFMQWAAFLGFCLFYWYHPSSQVTQSKLENNWDYGRHAGWNCTPMLNDPFYRARYNHDTCKELMLKPTEVKTLKINVDPVHPHRKLHRYLPLRKRHRVQVHPLQGHGRPRRQARRRPARLAHRQHV